MAWTHEQELAIHESGTNIIVSAGAGSGKTAVLSARVGEKIQQSIHIDELLILTFTNAAAGEMKERIKKKIKELNIPDELDRLESSYITTFDSFALSIVKKYHYLLNIPRDVTITDSSILNIQKKKILETIFDEYYEKKDNAYFQKLIYDFCLKDDKALKTAILKLIGKLEIRTDLEEYLENYLGIYYSDEKLRSYLADYYQILKDKIEALWVEIDIESSYFEQDYTEKVYEALRPLRTEISLNELIAKILISKIPASPRGSDEETKAAREKLSKMLQELKDACNYGYEEDILKSILVTKDYLTIVLEIVREFFKRFEDFKNQNHCYDFTDIAHLSLKVIREHKEVQEELQKRFKEIMVDEYQDTSDIQEEFISLIANHNVYMVGDIKQSIYRFRNANPYIFKNKYDAYSKGIDGRKIDLLKNFRSRDEVLEDINTIFNPIMTNKIGNAEYTESHQMVFGNTIYNEEGKTSENYHMDILEYELTNKEYSKDEVELFAIAEDIKKKIEQGYPIFDKDEKKIHPATYQDFCIIMDRNSTFDLAKKIFEYLGIPLCLYKDEVLNEDVDIYLIKNVITLLICMIKKDYSNDFRYAFTSIARSYLYELSDEEIFDCFALNDFFHTPVIKDLLPITKKIFSSSLREILESILEQIKFYEKTIIHGNVLESEIRVQKILELADNLSELGYNVFDFKDYLTELLETGETIKFNLGTSASNAVKMMNIHKSKGIEFPVCYFCGLYKSFSKDDLKGIIIYENGLPIYMPNRTNGIQETILKLLIQDKIVKDDISEKIRLFYVALTRAKEKMIFLLPKKDNLHELKENGIVYESIRYRYQSLAGMLYSIPNTLKIFTKSLNLDGISLTKDYLFPKTLQNELEKRKSNITVFPISITEKQEKKSSYSKKIKTLLSKEEQRNIELGLKVHEVLEFVDFKHFHPEDIEDGFIRNLVVRLLEQPIMQNLDEATLYQELEFIYSYQQEQKHGIIDLMIEREQTIDIIDYKLNEITDENYLKQLKGYQEYVSSKTTKKVSIYLYSILSCELKAL